MSDVATPEAMKRAREICVGIAIPDTEHDVEYIARAVDEAVRERDRRWVYIASTLMRAADETVGYDDLAEVHNEALGKLLAEMGVPGTPAVSDLPKR